MSVDCRNAHEQMWETLKIEMDKRCQYGPDFGRHLACYVLRMMGQIERDVTNSDKTGILNIK